MTAPGADADMASLVARADAFVNERLLCLEGDPNAFGAGEHVAEEALASLRAEAKTRGLWCPQMPASRGGLGLGPVGMSVVYEALGRSRFGPAACNCAAPDDGNMLVLEKVATDEQKARWLQPIVDGRVLMRDRRVLTIDIPATLAAAERYRQKISASVGGPK